MTLMQRRRALMAGKGEKTYISGNGYEYTADMTVKRSGVLPWDTWLSTMGSMPQLKSVTFVGNFRPATSAGYLFAEDGIPNLTTYAPNVEVLRFKHTGTATFKSGHYPFYWLPASVKTIELGSMSGEGAPWTGGGYFRKNNSNLVPPWTKGSIVGNTYGLTIIAYMDHYNKKCGWYKAGSNPTTVFRCLDASTGEPFTT